MSQNFIGVLGGIGAMFIWSFLPYTIKMVLLSTNSSTFLLLKYGLSTLPLSFLLPRILIKLRSTPRFSLLTSGIMIVICNFTQIFYLSEILGTWHIVFFSCTPILTLLLSSDLKNAQIKLSIVMVFIGCSLFILNENASNFPSWKHILYLTISTVSWVSVVLNIKKVQDFYSDLEIAFIFNFLSLLSAILLILINSEQFISPNQQALNLLCLICILCPLGSLFFNISLRKTPVFCVLSQYLQLIFGLVIGVWIFNEPSNSWQWLGAAFIIIALLVNNNLFLIWLSILTKFRIMSKIFRD